MAAEKLKFKIKLYSTFWQKPPHVKIKILEENDLDKSKNYFDTQSNKPILDIDPNYYDNVIRGKEESPTIIEFDHFFEEEKKYKLQMIRSGKTADQTIVDKNNNIDRDQLLHIKSIEIDDIDIGSLVFDGIYTPIYPEPWYSQQVKANKMPEQSFKNATTLGHNGTWEIGFTTPFYMWLLENLY